MERKTYSITIAAPRETVWRTLWDDASYREWTAVFAPGSRAETDWKEGSIVRFVDGTNTGMIALIKENTPNERMLFQHQGVIKNGEEDTSNPENKAWAGAIEQYTLREENGHTRLDITADLLPAYLDYFEQAWPKALEKLKSLAESRPR
jgi:uncharacterized protein YndB with AHSA1/START domain